MAALLQPAATTTTTDGDEGGPFLTLELSHGPDSRYCLHMRGPDGEAVRITAQGGAIAQVTSAAITRALR